MKWLGSERHFLKSEFQHFRARMCVGDPTFGRRVALLWLEAEPRAVAVLRQNGFHHHTCVMCDGCCKAGEKATLPLPFLPKAQPLWLH